MIKFDKNEFLKTQIYSTLDEYETRCNVTKEIIKEIEQLQQQCRKQKEVTDKAIEYINNLECLHIGIGENEYNLDKMYGSTKNYVRDLLEILKGSDE